MPRIDRRYLRTILLGVAAMGALVWVAVDQFGISRREMGELFLATVMVITVIIVAAGLVAALWMGLRKLHARSRE